MRSACADYAVLALLSASHSDNSVENEWEQVSKGSLYTVSRWQDGAAASAPYCKDGAAASAPH